MKKSFLTLYTTPSLLIFLVFSYLLLGCFSHSSQYNITTKTPPPISKKKSHRNGQEKKKMKKKSLCTFWFFFPVSVSSRLHVRQAAAEIFFSFLLLLLVSGDLSSPLFRKFPCFTWRPLAADFHDLSTSPGFLLAFFFSSPLLRCNRIAIGASTIQRRQESQRNKI